MDDLPSPEPQVQIAQKSFWQTPRSKIIIISGGVLILTAIIFISNYLGINKQPTPANQTVLPSPMPASATPTLTMPTLVFNCPVAKNLCNSGKQTTFNSNPALSYLLPTGTSILRIAPVTSSRRINNTLYEAFIFQNKDCYLISYILPNSSEFSTKLSPPYQRMETIGTTSSLILQLQKISLNQLSDTKNCDITRNEPKDFGSYQPVTPQTFQ